MEPAALSGLLEAFRKAENLKNTLRSAYTSQGRPESSAEHSWRLCLFVMLAAPYLENVDAGKMLRLAVIHDLGEAVCGDIPAPAQTANDDKADVERAAMEEICSTLPQALAAEILALWQEYENASTREALLVKALDKLETIFQHTQGDNPPGQIDYTFDLAYGREYADIHPFIRQLRNEAERLTTLKANAKK